MKKVLVTLLLTGLAVSSAFGANINMQALEKAAKSLSNTNLFTKTQKCPNIKDVPTLKKTACLVACKIGRNLDKPMKLLPNDIAKKIAGNCKCVCQETNNPKAADILNNYL